MKIVRNNFFIGTCVLAALVLFPSCKTETGPGTVKDPAMVPVAKEAPKAPAPSDARGILKLAAENSLNAKSVSSNIEMNIEMMGMKMALTFDIAKNGENTCTKGEFMGMRFEGYSDGKNLVMLDPMSGRWTRVPPEQKDMMMSLEQVQRKMYGEHLQDAVLGKEEIMPDKAYYVIEATVKPGAFKDMLGGNNPMMQGMDIKFDKTDLKVWIEKNTYLISRTVIAMEASMTGDIPGMGGAEPGNDIEDEEEVKDPKTSSPKTDDKKPEEPKVTKIKYEIEINNSDYNKVEPIVVPPEAKNLLESPPVVEPTNK